MGEGRVSERGPLKSKLGIARQNVRIVIKHKYKALNVHVLVQLRRFLITRQVNVCYQTDFLTLVGDLESLSITAWKRRQMLTFEGKKL